MEPIDVIIVMGFIIVFTLLSFRQSIEPEFSDVALKALDARLRTSGMTEIECKLCTLF